MTTLDAPFPATLTAVDRPRGPVPAAGDAATRRTLTIGPHTIDTPVVLAPMAGITNMEIGRASCRERV